MCSRLTPKLRMKFEERPALFEPPTAVKRVDLAAPVDRPAAEQAEDVEVVAPGNTVAAGFDTSEPDAPLCAHDVAPDAANRTSTALRWTVVKSSTVRSLPMTVPARSRSR